MRSNIKLSFWSLITVLLLMGVGGCLKKSKARKQGAGIGNDDFVMTYYKQNPFAGNDRVAVGMGGALAQIRVTPASITGLDKDSLWALAACECSPVFNKIYTTKLMQGHGVLPQILVPSIREEVRNQPLLKSLLKLGGSGGLGSNIAKLLVRDSKINTQVRKGLTEKLNNSLATSTNVLDELSLNLDLFISPTQNIGLGDAYLPKSMDIDDQASKWAYVMSLGGLWGETSTSKLDPAVQLVATMATLAEWSYAFGLDTAADGRVYGGITIDPRNGINSPLRAFDPRKTTSGAGVITGSYGVSYQDKSQVDLATSVTEKWHRNPSGVVLDEQARLWAAAAKAYLRLRPSERKVPKLFASSAAPGAGGGMIPFEAHLLPLAFLPGMAALLDGGFINLKELHISEQAKIVADTSNLAVDRTASLRSLARLTRALSLWTLALEKIEGDQIPASTLKEIQASRTKLKDVLRLSVQTILDSYVDTSLPSSKLGGIALVESVVNPIKPPMDIAAEVLFALTDAELNVFQDNGSMTDFTMKLIALHHWFAAEYLEPIAQSPNMIQLTPSAAFWASAALKNLQRFPSQLVQAVWLNDAQAQIQKAIATWDGVSP